MRERIAAGRAALGAMRRAAAIRRAAPKTGAYQWFTGNPYCEMLYSGFPDALSPEPMKLLSELEAFSRLPDRLLFVHSEQSYAWGVAEAQMDAQRHRYRRALERLIARGGRLVWTIHDDALHVIPSQAAPVARLRAWLAEHAALVHVHSETARQHVMAQYGIARDRLVVIPHPSYHGIYTAGGAPPRRDPEAGAGWRLLCFGFVSPYKDYEGLARALTALPAESFARLTIAGRLHDGVALPEAAYRRSLDLELQLRFIPDAEVADFFAEADFAVLPYTAGLTSGVASLALGFGVPVIAPRIGGMADAVPAENHPLLYDPTSETGLQEALRRAAAMSAETHDALRQACLKEAEAAAPLTVSRALLQQLRQRGLLPD